MAIHKIGSVGLGSISNGVHIPGIIESPDLELVAICDIDEKKLHEKGEAYGIPPERRFTDYRDLIACPEVEAVDISTPNNVHMEIAAAAAAAGKPYGVEKPMTMDTAQAEELAHITRENRVKSMVYFSYRYKAAARYMRHLVRSGKIGPIHHVQMQYYQSWGLEHINCPLVWRFVKEITASGALGDLGCHGLDLVSFVTGKEYKSVSAHLGTVVHQRRLRDGSGMGTVDVDDFSNILAEMDGGTSASFQISRLAYGRGNYQRMEVYGEYGALVYHLDRIPGVDELEICTKESDAKYVTAEIPEEFKARQMQAFADILNDCADGLSATVEDGVISEKILDSIILSDAEKKWVKIPQ